MDRPLELNKNTDEHPIFLNLKVGDFILISNISENPSKLLNNGTWIGQVIHCIGSARDPEINTLFQVIDIGSKEIKIINADLVKSFIESNKKSKVISLNP